MKLPELKRHLSSGFSLVELIIVVAIAGIIFLTIAQVIGSSLQAREYTREQYELTQDARFAMERMVRAVSRTDRLILPLAENTVTAWSESIRDPGVLAVTMDPTIDRDNDGWADANNDKDYLDINNNSTRDPGEPELVDEDPQGDNNADGAPGIAGIDDDGDGTVDNGFDKNDEDEDGVKDEDGFNGIDDDGDGTIDEDSAVDSNSDGAPGLAGVDDNYNGIVDDGFNNGDDDEDNVKDEDWLDTVVYYLAGSKLMERMPNINPVDGTDYTENIIANYVSGFRIERLVLGGKKKEVIDIKLTLQDSLGDPISLNTRIRVGAGR